MASPSGLSYLFSPMRSLVLGYIHQALQPGGEPRTLESWARLVYPGLIIIIQAILVLAFVGWPGSLTIGRWWLAAVSNGLIVAAVVLVNALGISLPTFNCQPAALLRKFQAGYSQGWNLFFRLDWIYRGTVVCQ